MIIVFHVWFQTDVNMNAITDGIIDWQYNPISSVSFWTVVLNQYNSIINPNVNNTIIILSFMWNYKPEIHKSNPFSFFISSLYSKIINVILKEGLNDV